MQICDKKTTTFKSHFGKKVANFLKDWIGVSNMDFYRRVAYADPTLSDLHMPRGRSGAGP